MRDQIEELNLNPPISNECNMALEKDEEIERMNEKLNEMIEKYKYSEAEKGNQQI